MSAVALYDTLNCMRMAAGAGNRARAEAAMAAASAAARGAFPAGSPEAAALSVLLAMDPVPLRDALNGASLSVLAAEDGDPACAWAALLEARFAASAAFPAVSPESEALGIVLAAVERVHSDGSGGDPETAGRR